MSRSHASVPPRAAHRALRRALGAALLLPFLTTSAHAQVRRTIRDRAAQDKERAAATPRTLQGLAVIDGVVTDTLLRPLASADVSVVGTNARVITSDNGRFRMLQVPAGQYLLVVRRIGYAPTSGIIEVPEADTMRLAYTLTRSSLLLDTVRVKERRVTMRMLEFEQRRMQGQGQFITREDIERRNSMAAFDFLRNVRGVDVQRITNTQFAGMVALSKREGGSVGGDGSGACAMQILLDGIVLPRFFNLELLPPPQQIAGIEVYSGAATVPPQFGGADRRCGLVAVWTRDGY
jgi:hypothetical protein